MPNSNHHWTTFYKGRLRVKACSKCGEMSLPSNTEALCEGKNIVLSPILKAGYSLTKLLSQINRVA